MVDLAVPGGREKGDRRGLLATAGAAVLILAAVGLAPNSASRAATGTEPDSSPVYVGFLTTDENRCTATVVRPWMAVTAKHCGTQGLELKIGVTLASDSDPDKKYEVVKVVPHGTLDIEALYLNRNRSAPWDEFVAWGDGSEYDPESGEPLQAWGFGADRNNVVNDSLIVAEFPKTIPCPSGLAGDQGDFCLEADSLNSLCVGDSGGPITQGDNIVGIATAVKRKDPSAPFSCEDVVAVQAISVPKIAGWLHDRSCEAAPPEQWPCG